VLSLANGAQTFPLPQSAADEHFRRQFVPKQVQLVPLQLCEGVQVLVHCQLPALPVHALPSGQRAELPLQPATQVFEVRSQ
jgi:predicted component of type VI protein secretion system